MEYPFLERLAELGLSEEQVIAVCQLIDVEIIGDYESSPAPEFAHSDEVGVWIEKSDLEASRNGLRKEQVKKLGPGWHARKVSSQTARQSRKRDV